MVIIKAALELVKYQGKIENKSNLEEKLMKV